MKARSAIVCAAAAAVVLLAGGGVVRAETLTWDADGAAGSLGADGGGNWTTDPTKLNWVSGDTTSGTNVAWTNGKSAVFGNGTSGVTSTAAPNTITVVDPITVQDITLGVGTNGTYYNIQDDFFAGSLTLNGNVTKTAVGGTLSFFLGNGLTLGSGDHVFALKDTPGNLPELTMNNAIAGAGNLVLDNGSQGYESWGTLFLAADSTYAGSTTITKGRVVITSGGALSTSSKGVFIGDDGALSVGEGFAPVTAGGVSLNQAFTISRSDYGSDADHSHYPYAVLFTNGSGSSTMSGPITVNSTDARIRVETSNVVISGKVSEGAGVAPGTGVLTFTGDFAGFVQLTGDNSAYTGAFRLLSGVEVRPANQNAIGGPNSKILFTGDATLRPPTDMPNFGSHQVNYDSFSGGLDVPAGQAFTVDHALSGGSGLGERGAGTLNINQAVTGTGAVFWDGVDATADGGATGGIINVNAAVTVGALRLRSPVVNIGTGGSVTTTNSFNSFGVDTHGTNGAADNATINVTGTGALIQQNAADFNISDNAGTKGTITVKDNGVLTTKGDTYLGKSNGAVGVLNIQDNAQVTTNGITWVGKNGGSSGTVNQSGGSLTINRPFNFGFVIADGRGNTNPVGHYNLSGGTFTSAGEVYVGEGGDGAVGGTRAHGFWTQTGGTANVNNWFVIGRENAVGAFDMSAGVLNHSGGNMSMGDSGAGGELNTIKVYGTAVINDNAGDFYVGQNGATARLDLLDGAKITVSTGQFWVGNGSGGGAGGTANVSGSALLTVNNWFAVGRAGGTGTLNVSGGAVTQQTSNWFTIGSGGTGVVNVSGGAVNALQTYVGQNGGGSGTLNVSGGAVTLGNTIIGNQDSVSGAVNLSGGSLTATSITAGGSSGTKAFSFTGGQLTVGSYGLAGALSNGGTGALAPGGAGAVGATSVAGGYVQGSGATLAIDIAGGSLFDAVTAGGDSVINGLVSVDVLGSFVAAPGSFYDVLVSATSLTGAPVLGGPDGGLFTESIVNGNTLRLTVPGGAVPEPGALCVLAVVGAGVLGGRRRRGR